jgi:predicted MFS family arabinose efflux permease
VSAAFVRHLPAAPPKEGPYEPINAAIQAGLRHLFKTPDLRALAFGTSTYNFGYSMAIATFVLYVTDVLRVPNALYGVLLAASAIGGVVAGWHARSITRRFSYRQTMGLATLGQALAWAAVAATHDVRVAGATFLLLGGCGSLSSVAVGSARQALTPDGLIGRVVTAFRLFSFGAAGLGALSGGVVADRYNLTAPLIVAAVALLVAASLTAWPVLRQQPAK